MTAPRAPRSIFEAFHLILAIQNLTWRASAPLVCNNQILWGVRYGRNMLAHRRDFGWTDCHAVGQQDTWNTKTINSVKRFGEARLG